jgi:WD40 repeat protein
MKYELTHDTIARQIYEQASDQLKARRRARLLVGRALERYRDRGVLLRQEDLDEVRPYEKSIHFSPAERQLIEASRRALAAAARRRRNIALGVIAALTLFLAIALWQWKAAAESAEAQRRMRLALQADRELNAGRPSVAFRLAQYAYSTKNDSSTQAVIDDVLRRLDNSRLYADLVHEGPVTRIGFGPGDSLLITASADGTIRLWDTLGWPRDTLHHRGPVTDFDLGSGGALLSASLDSTAGIWKMGGAEHRSAAHPAPVLSVDAHPTAPLLLTAAADRQVRLFNFEGDLIESFAAEDTILTAQFSPDGNYFLIASPGLVWVQGIKAGGRLILPRFKVEREVRKASFVQSDETRLATVLIGKDRTLILNSDGEVDTTAFYTLLNNEIRDYPAIEEVRFSHPIPGDTTKLLFITRDSLILWWTAKEFDEQLRPSGNIDYRIHPKAGVTWAGFSGANRYVLSASQTNWAEFWDLREKRISHRLQCVIHKAAFSASDRWMLTGAGDHSAKLWRLHPSGDRYQMEQLMKHFDARLRALLPEEKHRFRTPEQASPPSN